MWLLLLLVLLLLLLLLLELLIISRSIRSTRHHSCLRGRTGCEMLRLVLVPVHDRRDAELLLRQWLRSS